MSHFNTLLEYWTETAKCFDAEPWMKRVSQAEIELKHYKSFLQETYFETQRNPQVQAFATAYLDVDQHAMIKKFYAHAASEVGHDQLALNDLKAVGHDIEKTKKDRPLPSTIGLISLPFYLIQFVNPVAYLGYLFHLEFFPTKKASEYMQGLGKLNVPKEALSFLLDHSEIDQHHNKMMEDYANVLIKNDKDMADVQFAIRSACHLHMNMIVGAFEVANKSDKFN